MRAPRISSNTSHCFSTSGAVVIWRLFNPNASGDATLHFSLTCSGQKELFSNCHAEGRLSCDYLQLKNGFIVAKISNRKVTFLWVHCKSHFFAVNLPSQITLLSLRISYVFSSLSPLNLPLSCPEPFVANRARRSEVFKVDVWVGNSAKLECSLWFPAQCFLLPTGLWCLSAFISVCVSQSQRPHAACITFSSEEVCV